MCHKLHNDENSRLPLQLVKKQLEEIWEQTEFLKSSLSNDCKQAQNVLKPYPCPESYQSSTNFALSTALPKSPVIEPIEEKICEKIDHVIQYTHNAIEKSKICKYEENTKRITQKLTYKRISPKGDIKVKPKEEKGKHEEKSRNVPKSTNSTQVAKLKVLQSTYQNAFNFSRNSNRKHKEGSNKTKKTPTKVNNKSSTESSKKTKAFDFDGIDDLLSRVTATASNTCSSNYNRSTQTTIDQSKSNVEECKQQPKPSFIKLSEALYSGLIKPPVELIKIIDTHHQILVQINSISKSSMECTATATFVRKLELRNESHALSRTKEAEELKRCLEMIEKCPIRSTEKPALHLHGSNESETLVLMYNNVSKWVEFETMKVQAQMYGMQLDLFKTLKLDLLQLKHVLGNTTLFSKTCESLSTII